ncbi:MAG: hypothetical protein R3A51_12260 [Nannocystaceae bacterium]
MSAIPQRLAVAAALVLASRPGDALAGPSPTDDREPMEGGSEEPEAAPVEAPPERVAGADDVGPHKAPPIPVTTPQLARQKEPEGDTKLIKDLEARVTGSISFSIFHKTWPNEQGDRAVGFGANFDRIGVGLDGTYKGLLMSADYRFFGKYAMLHHGYIGYRYKDIYEVDVGVHKVPLGILPYTSHSWFLTLPYYVGMADDYDLGIKQKLTLGGFDLQLAYYIISEPAQFGATGDSARYSYDFVTTDADELGYAGVTSKQSNKEMHRANGRLAYTFEHRGGGTTEIGGSGFYGGLYNTELDSFGDQWAAVVHYNGNYKGFNLQVEGLYYHHRPLREGVQDPRWVTMGAYDAPYRVASRGLVVVGNIGYTLELPWEAFDWVMFYNDYSFLFKPDYSSQSTHMNVTGILLANQYVYIFFDTAVGLNHPWFSPQYGQALAEGEDDPKPWLWINLNFGYYF